MERDTSKWSTPAAGLEEDMATISSFRPCWRFILSLGDICHQMFSSQSHQDTYARRPWRLGQGPGKELSIAVKGVRKDLGLG